MFVEFVDVVGDLFHSCAGLSYRRALVDYSVSDVLNISGNFVHCRCGFNHIACKVIAGIG